MKRSKHMPRRALFILKLRQDYTSEYGANHLATGMYNSAKFVSDMLEESGIESKVVIVVDNNAIDKEVKKYKPTHVFIEGIWVVPEKFEVLMKLHKKVKWIVRCHSEIPFLAQEGNAIDWIFEYAKRGVYVSGNSSRVNKALQSLVGDSLGLEDVNESMPMLPNYYPVDDEFVFSDREDRDEINIGCFGAIRPLKNQLIQAVAAIKFAKIRDVKLKFHINAARVEQNGANQLKNIQKMFAQLGDQYQLVEHPWMDHHTFKRLLRKMDICMQVSMSETFNIVTADAVSVGTPTVVSDEVTWAFPDTWAKPTDLDDLVDVLEYVWDHRSEVVYESYSCLEEFSDRSKHTWVHYLNKY
jgi:glycosyltransferase involved in cell wall biosynthesis